MAAYRRALIVMCIVAVTAAHRITLATDWAVLGTRINGQPGPDLMVLREGFGGTFIKQADLPALRLHQLQPPVVRNEDGHAWIALDQIPGLSLTLDTTRQVLEIMADPALLPLTQINGSSRGRGAERLGQTSAFLNWGMEHQHSGATTSLRLSNELGLRLGPVLLQSNATSREERGTQRYVRLTTTATRDWPERQQRLVLGDFPVQATELAGTANLGGVSLARVFALDAYTSRRSSPQLQGQLLYPSEVEIQVDGRPIRREQLPAGGFTIQDLYLPEGGRSVQIVTRDPYGRVQTTDYSFYASESLLRQGTSEFQYALGALRRGYGLRSAGYGPWALSAYQRAGLTPQLTLGGMVQARDGLLQFGATGVTPLALGPGLLAWSVAGSRTDAGSGYAATVRYNMQGKSWGLGGSWRHDGRGYAALSDPVAPSPGQSTAGVYGNMRLGDWGGLSLSHTRQATQILPLVQSAWAAQSSPLDYRLRRSTTLGWSRSIGGFGGYGSWLRVDMTQTVDAGQVNYRLGMLLSLSLDRRIRLRLSANGDPGQQTGDGAVQLSRPLWPGETWGWDLGLDHSASASGGLSVQRAATDLQARYGQMRGDWRHAGIGPTANSLRVTAGGGVALIGGGLYFSRPIGDAYAIARVGMLADVPITVNGVTVGHTNGKGELLIPNLSAHYDNQLGVDSSNIPIDYVLDRVSRRITLPARTGAVVEFKVTRIRVLEGQLVLTATGAPLRSAPLRIQAAGAEIDGATDSEGGLYLEQLPIGHHTGSAEIEGGRCSFVVEMPDNEETLVVAGRIACE